MSGEGEQDPRVNHIKLSAEQAIDLDLNDWEELIWKEENIATLKDFFDTPNINLLLLYYDRNEKLAFSHEISRNTIPKRPLCIFIKSAPNISVENHRNALSFYNVVNLPLKEFEILFEKVMCPTYRSPFNNQRWPGEIAQDISYHFQHFRTSMSYHVGLAERRTVLLVPEMAKLIGDYDVCNISENDIYDLNLRNVLNSITEMLSTWIPVVRDVLELTSEQVFSQEKLGPSSEIKFWDERKNNLQFIYSQVNDPIVRDMVLALERVNSSHFAKFKTFLQEIAESLDEAREICSKFENMQKILNKLDNSSIPDLCECLPDSMNSITTSWMKSEYYRTVPSYVTVLLQKVSCLLIDKTHKYLEPTTIFKEDRNETNQKVWMSANVVDIFLKWYEKCREQFDSNDPKPYPWVFPDIRVFTPFEIFINRLKQIKDVFDAAEVYSNLPYHKLTNVQQASFRKRIVDLKSLFFEAYEVFEESTYNPLDTDSKDFVTDYDQFSTKLKNLDSKMGIVIGQVCLSYVPAKDAFKFFDALQDILERPLVQKEFTIVIASYAHKMYKEILVSQEKYNSHSVQEECDQILYKSLPPISGALQWLADERGRTLPPFEKLKKEAQYFKECDTYNFTFQIYGAVAKLFSEFETYVTDKWNGILKKFDDRTDEQLFLFDTEDICLNFNHQVSEVFQEVRYLRQIEKFDLVPSNFFQFYEGYENLLTAQSFLACSTKWYNELQKTLVESEKILIADEWDRIIFLIDEGKSKTWTDLELFTYAEELYTLTLRVYENMNQAKRNITEVQESINLWTHTPMFERESSNSLVDFTINLFPPLEKQMLSVELSALLISNALEDNLQLLQRDLNSEEGEQYGEYVESVFETGLKKSIECSLQYIFENTNPLKKRMAPFYRISVILDGDLKFAPPLTVDEPGNLFELFENVLEKIYSPAQSIKRLVNKEYSYYDAVNESAELKALKTSIMDNVSSGAENALIKSEIFYQYSEMWESSVDEVLEDFVLYGPIQENPVPDEDEFVEEPELELKAPTEDEFKAQILEFEELYKKVEDIPVVLDIESWLILDVSPFKSSLLSTIMEWSATYKKKLIELKRLGKLRKLEDDSEM